MDGYPYEMVIVNTAGKVTEYFCFGCKQLRLSCIADKSKCQNCGCKDIIHGEPGTLDKAKLLREGRGTQL